MQIKSTEKLVKVKVIKVDNTELYAHNSFLYAVGTKSKNQKTTISRQYSWTEQVVLVNI